MIDESNSEDRTRRGPSGTRRTSPASGPPGNGSTPRPATGARRRRRRRGRPSGTRPTPLSVEPFAQAVDPMSADPQPSGTPRTTLDAVPRADKMDYVGVDLDVPGPRPGTYRGQVRGSQGASFDLDLRLDFEHELLSADFFRHGAIQLSVRGPLRADEEGCYSEPLRVFFVGGESSLLGGSLEFEALGEDAVSIWVTLPEPLPMDYQGSAVFSSDTFRVLDIEIDKLGGMPWPPEFSSAEIPPEDQPPDCPPRQLSLEELLRGAGIEARIHYGDSGLDGQRGRSTGRPGEEDRWDERELHEMMEAHTSRRLDAREWWLYLLTVTRFDGGPAKRKNGTLITGDDGQPTNAGRGVTGIIFDHSSGLIRDPWSEVADWLQREHPQWRQLVDYGRQGGFRNRRARQGVAVFWQELADLASDQDPQWKLDRTFLRTIVHELGHALNLPHCWLVGRPASTSFMNYPHYFPRGLGAGERSRNYWRQFEYTFDPEEIFHLWHGFYDEVVPGGDLEFMQWTPTSVFRTTEPRARGVRSHLSIELTTNRQEYCFTEPPQLNVTVKNLSGQEVPVGHLGPSWGNVRYIVRKPGGEIDLYQPPLTKCEHEKSGLARGEQDSHTTTLLFGRNGFLFDRPGRYEVAAALPDPSSGSLVVSKPVTIWICYPERRGKVDENHLANVIFEPEVGLFLYLGGGEHLKGGKQAVEKVTEEFATHPTAAHCHLALGLNAMRGQKRLPLMHSSHRQAIVSAAPEKAASSLQQAMKQKKVFDAHSQKRLAQTLSLCVAYADGDRGAKTDD